MLLRELTRYYSQNRNVMPPFGWQLHYLRWVIVINSDGEFCDIEDWATPKNKKGRMIYVPKKVVRTRGISSCQLWDHSGYVLGVDEDDPERAEALHACFVERCQLIADETGDMGAEAVATFISSMQEQEIDRHPLYEELIKAETISFRLDTDNVLVFNRPTVFEWLSENPLSSGTKYGQCMVCGKWGNIERILPTIKGIRGCDPIGVRLTSINNIRTGNSCLGAYGLTQGYSAPTCEQCAYRYGNSLNHLLRSDSHNKIHIGPFTLVFWCPQGRDIELLFRKILLGGQDARQAKDERGNLYWKPSPRKIHWVPEPSYCIEEKLNRNTQKRYMNIVVFRGKERRIAIEYYQRISTTALVDGLRHWVSCTVDPCRENKPLILFLSHCIAGNDLGGLNTSVLIGILGAIFNKKPINYETIKKLRNCNFSSFSSSSLYARLVFYMSSLIDKDAITSKPSLCGKLIALLVKCQEEANGESTTIRCDSAVITNPARKIAVYLKKNRHHLSLIGKQNYGRRVNLEKDIQITVSEIGVFPEILDPDEQLSLLAGYYCARNELFKANGS
ncbi:type I-C CRISPR-associated protein Cas8c/Csd1 [Endozoicomonas acroporae]|uniref:type I-C CRISPR-associated protein Cas8c/Csd1 n=1 Tax=Endozoicomonas acroporae TaxID=1701104 RepID=UPI000C771C2F|nr:type I-C CRISPR-associated protein Cas8c/Csd1 [Endozoicomonas acroporae]